MTTLQRPCSGFTAFDLKSLQAIWPEGTHESDADDDRFLIFRRAERILAVDQRGIAAAPDAADPIGRAGR